MASASSAWFQQPMGPARADRLQRFYSAYYNKLSDGNQDATDRQAFQLAVWELVYEGTDTYSLSDGDLTVARGGSTDVINRANAWLAGSWQTGAGGQTPGVPGGGSSGPDPGTVITDPDEPPVIEPPDDPPPAVLPVPGAALLGLLGFSLIGWAKRRLR